jgi:hypothetical protein
MGSQMSLLGFFQQLVRSALRVERGGLQIESPGIQSPVGVLGQCQMLGCHGLLHERHIADPREEFARLLGQ